MNTYIRFEHDTLASADRKTEIWNVVSNSSGALLGRIKWFGRWRQYTFYPEPDTIYNPDCLADIAAKCEAETFRHRSAQRQQQRGEVPA